jgi:hypothetical protein
MNDIMSRQDWWGQVIDFKKQLIACPHDLSLPRRCSLRTVKTSPSTPNNRILIRTIE